VKESEILTCKRKEGESVHEKKEKGIERIDREKKCLHLLQATMIMGIYELLHMRWVLIMEKCKQNGQNKMKEGEKNDLK
jgi:hypothetical protein